MSIATDEFQRCKSKLNNPRRKNPLRALCRERYAQQRSRQKISCTGRGSQRVWCRPLSKMSLCMMEDASWYGSNMSRASRMLREHCTRAEFQKRLSCPCCNIRECVIIWATDQPERGHYESDSMAVKIGAGDYDPATDPCCMAGKVVCGIPASLFCMDFLSAGQCATGNGDSFVPHAAVRVEDVEATVAELAQMGIECEPIRLDSYTKKKMTFFFDPDGLPLELHE